MSDPADLQGEGRRIEIAADVISQIKRFRHVRLSLLEAEILARLIHGRRTSTELVVEIYGTQRESPGFVADYYRVRRTVRNLERRGYVSSPLLGKEKPIRLTLHGIASLTSIGGMETGSRLLPSHDLVIYSLSILLAITTLWGSLRPDVLGDLGLMWILNIASASFLVFLGASMVRLTETLRRVV